MSAPLPIYEIQDQILSCLRRDRRLILSAPTGSGKSTQVPQMLLRHGFLERGQVVILQPRRLAARLLAARVARELGVRLGQEVGYQVRFENCTSAQTRIRFVTEGVLLRQMLDDPQLHGVSVLIFDEFHERHLYGDITLARALDLQEQSRPDLSLIVMSATLNAGELENYLNPCAVLSSAGRQFPVEIEYAAPPDRNDRRPIWEQAAEAFARYVSRGGEGDVLIFMPGGFEISQTIEALRHTPASKGFILLPLHGELEPPAQDAAVARYEQRKVVVATNVAETSITIDGIRCVIDSGLARLPRYDAHRGINTLFIEKISQASADQRAGRAGRTAPGVCLRLWSREEHSHRPPRELPEIKRLDLAEVVLTLKAAGVDDLRKFRWLEPPDEIALTHAEELLRDLGALDKQNGLTPLGRQMLAFPLHPRYSRLLLAAQQYGCVYQAALVAALTQGRDLLRRQVDKTVTAARDDWLGEQATSDFWILMRAWQFAVRNQFRPDACRRLGIQAAAARQIGPLHEQFLRIAEQEGLDITPRDAGDDALRKCVLIAFSDRLARRLDSGTLRCELVHHRRGVLARESAVQNHKLFVAAEIREIQTPSSPAATKDVHTLLSLATAIEPEWLRELFPDDVQSEWRVEFDPTQKRVVAAQILKFRDLTLSARSVEPPPAEAASKILAVEILAGRLPLPCWDHEVEQWIARLNFLRAHCPELQLPPFSDDDRRHVIEQLCHGAVSYREVKEREVKPLIQSRLSPPQRELLEREAPERLRLPNGRTPKVNYANGQAPFIALRIQELYDVHQTPRLARGKVPVTVHILSPGMKPVQVTQDLANFWRVHYPKIKSELQRRYPKHFWR